MRKMIREEVEACLRTLAAASPAPQAVGPELLTPTQAAALVSMGTSTLRLWVRQGRLACMGSGRNTRFDRAELMRAVAERGQAPKAAIPVAALAREILRR